MAESIIPASVNLPSISKARLPVSYEHAKQALSNCERIDECKDWADKAAALASYGKQADDETLYSMAVRIRARAVRRCGELLKEVAPAKNQHQASARTGVGTSSRSQAAEQAGLSKRQKATALQVANVPAEEFESSIESDHPLTITALADLGKRSQPKPLMDLQGRSEADFKCSTQAQGEIRRLAEFAGRIDVDAVARGTLPHESAGMLEHISAVIPWLKRLEKSLQ